MTDKAKRQKIYDNAKKVVEQVGPEWIGDHGWVRTSKFQLGYWDDFHFGLQNMPRPAYTVRQPLRSHVFAASPSLVIELMDEIAELRAEIAANNVQPFA